MQALVFIPTYNERENIENLINQILNLNLDIGILVVDDNSPDGTGGILEQICKTQPRLSVIHRFDKRSRGLASIAGFKYAIKQNVDYIIEMDADFSHDPKYIPLFLKEIKDCDVIIGSRLVQGGGTIGRSYFRNTLSLLGRCCVRFILNLNISDSTSGFRCFRRSCLGSVNLDELISQGPSVIEEIIFYMKKKGFRMKEVPIIFRDRRGGQSKFNLWEAFGVFFTLIKIRLSYCIGKLKMSFYTARNGP